jgi:hypothetical protein
MNNNDNYSAIFDGLSPLTKGISGLLESYPEINYRDVQLSTVFGFINLKIIYENKDLTCYINRSVFESCIDFNDYVDILEFIRDIKSLSTKKLLSLYLILGLNPIKDDDIDLLEYYTRIIDYYKLLLINKKKSEWSGV